MHWIIHLNLATVQAVFCAYISAIILIFAILEIRFIQH